MLEREPNNNIISNNRRRLNCVLLMFHEVVDIVCSLDGITQKEGKEIPLDLMTNMVVE